MNTGKQGLLFATISGFLLSGFAFAQAQRTFVSTSGNDVNPCTRTQPCRNFNAAIAVTAAGGEVFALDSGGYGAVTIDKPITLQAEGVSAAIAVFTGDAVTINPGASFVTLRGLLLNGLGDQNGIQYTADGVLHVEKCVFKHFRNGVNFASSGRLYFNDSVVRDWDGFGGSSIYMAPASGVAYASVDSSRFENNFNGVFADNNARVVVKNSVAAGNGNNGFIANGFSGFTTLDIENCVVSNNLYGIYAGGATNKVRVSNTVTVNNGTGWYSSASNLFTRGNNTLQDNGTQTVGTIVGFSAN